MWQVERKGGRINYKDNGDGTYAPYELNINYLSAITEPDDSNSLKAGKFLAAQSILLSFIGVPAIYYHSLLGSENDVQGMLDSGINRRINRKKLNLDELQAELAQTGSLRELVYSQMHRLLTLRQQYPAFSPQSAQKVLEQGDKLFALQRGESDQAIRFAVNLTSEEQTVEFDEPGFDLVTQEQVASRFILKPYQFVWLTQ